MSHHAFAKETWTRAIAMGEKNKSTQITAQYWISAYGCGFTWNISNDDKSGIHTLKAGRPDTSLFFTTKAGRTGLLHAKETAWSTGREKGEISCDLVEYPCFVRPIYAYDLFGGGSFVEWLFVIDPYSLHPQPAGWVGRNIIRYVRLNTHSLSGIMFFSAWTWEIRSIASFNWWTTYPV